MESSQELLRNVFNDPSHFLITNVKLIGVFVAFVHNSLLLKFEVCFVDKKEIG
jgi:hypothetical protein